MERKRFTLYTNWGKTNHVSELTFSLEAGPGLDPMTAFLPSGYSVGTTAAGKQVILDKQGQPIEQFGTQRAIGRPLITSAPQDGKTPSKAFCDIIDPRINMKVIAYRKKDKRVTRWSLDALEGSEPIAVYLPPYCKLVEMERTMKRYIQIPDTSPWQEVIAEDGSKYMAPPEPTLLSDFTGSGKGDAPYITIGPKRKTCYRAEAEDIYTPPSPAEPNITRLADGRYQIDTLITDQTTGTSIWSRKYSKTPPTKLK